MAELKRVGPRAGFQPTNKGDNAYTEQERELWCNVFVSCVNRNMMQVSAAKEADNAIKLYREKFGK